MSEITKEEKKRYQVVSRIISVVLRVANVLCWIGAGALVVCTVCMAAIAPNISINKDKKEISFFDDTTSYTIKDKEFEVGDKGERVTLKDNRLSIYNNDSEVFALTITEDAIAELDKLVEEELPKIINALPISMLFVSIVTVATALILGHGSRVFKNIATKKTPFIKDNITRISKAFKYSIASAVAATLANLVFAIIVGTTHNYIIEISAIVEVLILYVAIYIFRAGYQIEGIKQDEEAEE